MDLEAILAGVGAIVTAAAGVVLIVREFRRRERLASLKEIDEMSAELSRLRHDFLAFRRFAFGLAQMLADRGVDVPPAPAPSELSPEP